MDHKGDKLQNIHKNFEQTSKWMVPDAAWGKPSEIERASATVEVGACQQMGRDGKLAA
jgi:hypothetical protein